MQIRAFLVAVLGLSFLVPATPVIAQSAGPAPHRQLAQADTKDKDEAERKGPRARDDARGKGSERGKDAGKDADGAGREAMEKAKAAREAAGKSRDEAEAKAKAARDAAAKAGQEAKARSDAEAKAKAAADAKAKIEADARAKAAGDAKAKAETDAKAKAAADAKAKAEADARAKAGDAKAKAEADAKAKAAREARDADAKANAAADAKAKAEAATKAKAATRQQQTQERAKQPATRDGRDDDRRDSSRERDRDDDRRDARDRGRDDDRRDSSRERDRDDDRRDARDRGRDDNRRDRDDDRRDRDDDRRDLSRDRDRDDRDRFRDWAREREERRTSVDELRRTEIRGDRTITIDGGTRTLRREGDRVVIRGYDFDRLRHGRDGRGDTRVERLPNGHTRTVVFYPDGTQIVTVTGTRGEIVHRYRRDRGGREIVLIREVRRPPVAQLNLGPLRLTIPREQYIVDARHASRQDIRAALIAPPVEPVERVYSLEEVRQFDRIRDKMRRIDVTSITFETDSALIEPSQARALEELASVIADMIQRNPSEVFLIEGHTDLVGENLYNLALSDRRAEAVAVALTDYFNVPPENLVTQGYGEQYPKIPTDLSERENRRVAVRRITPLVAEN